MKVIDADAHIEECEATFSDAYLEPRFRNRRPMVIPGPFEQAFWLIDDVTLPRRHGPGASNLGTPAHYQGKLTPFTRGKPESLESLELRDRAARFADMQAENIDVQVLYPTLFLAYPLTADPDFQAALCRAYNNWMCDLRGGDERFGWVGVMPLDNVSAAVAEVRRLKTELHASGIMLLGLAGNDMLSHPRLLPFWEEVAAQDLPVALHVGWASPQLSSLAPNLLTSTVIAFLFPVLMGFAAILTSDLLDRFPNLRIGFMEAGCEWIHFMTHRLDHRRTFLNAIAKFLPLPKPVAAERAAEYVAGGRLFFNTEVEDDLLPQALQLVGEDQILFASDMPHGDRDRYAVKELRARQDLSAVAVEKILCTNAKRFYGWS
ncbi:MAG: amidohydrolase [Candidatus Tectomicrobia bacterium]|nr:amidohydrolase [Candidatus Tectomicrobia bacterium]